MIKLFFCVFIFFFFCLVYVLCVFSLFANTIIIPSSDFLFHCEYFHSVIFLLLTV
jgi:hypothetical protein